MCTKHFARVAVSVALIVGLIGCGGSGGSGKPFSPGLYRGDTQYVLRSKITPPFCMDLDFYSPPRSVGLKIEQLTDDQGNSSLGFMNEYITRFGYAYDLFLEAPTDADSVNFSEEQGPWTLSNENGSYECTMQSHSTTLSSGTLSIEYNSDYQFTCRRGNEVYECHLGQTGALARIAE